MSQSEKQRRFDIADVVKQKLDFGEAPVISVAYPGGFSGCPETPSPRP